MDLDLFHLKKTHNCNELKTSNIGHTICLCGWVHKRRYLGKLIFRYLHDQKGITQLIFNPEKKMIYDKANLVRHEYVIAIEGKVLERKNKIVILAETVKKILEDIK